MAITETLRTVDEAIAWIHAHPSKHQGGPWATTADSWCEQLMNNAGGFSQAFPTATAAGNASGTLNSDMGSAKAGEFVYWTNHVGLVTRPGVMLCASTSFAGNGSGWGEMEIAKYSTLHPNQHFRGHSYRHGSQTLKKVVAPVKKPPVAQPPVAKPPAPPDRVVIPTGKPLHGGDFYTVGAYTFGVGIDGSCTVKVAATGHVHVAFPQGPAGTYVTFQPDGNLVGNWLDPKGKRHVIFASKTQRKAAGGEMILTHAGSLVIFNRKHVEVKRWG